LFRIFSFSSGCTKIFINFGVDVANGNVFSSRTHHLLLSNLQYKLERPARAIKRIESLYIETSNSPYALAQNLKGKLKAWYLHVTLTRSGISKMARSQ
jgi:hypothetical protein